MTDYTPTTEDVALVLDRAMKLLEQQPNRWCTGYWFVGEGNELTSNFTYFLLDANHRLGYEDRYRWAAQGAIAEEAGYSYCAEGAVFVAAWEMTGELTAAADLGASALTHFLESYGVTLNILNDRVATALDAVESIRGFLSSEVE